jgi:glucose 1-dehydrogenase
MLFATRPKEAEPLMSPGKWPYHFMRGWALPWKKCVVKPNVHISLFPAPKPWTIRSADILVRPLVIAKALEQVVFIGRRSFWEPRTLLVTVAGPIGLLAALAAKMFGLDVHVLDRMESGTKPDLVRALGATYHSGSVKATGIQPDAIIECTGVGQVIADSIQAVGSSGTICLTGVGHGGVVSSDATANIAASAVLKNNVIVGSVNANKRHWYKAGNLLARADRKWLSRLITRREKPENFKQALERKPDDIKVVIQFSEA